MELLSQFFRSRNRANNTKPFGYLSIVSTLFLCVLVNTAALAGAKTKLYETYEGDVEGTIAVIPTDVENEFLIGYEGFEHAYDKQAFLYTRKPGNSGADSFVYEMNGVGATNFRSDGKRTLINGTSVPYYEVYLPGGLTFRVKYSAEANPNYKAEIQSRYASQQGLTQSKVKAKKSIAAATKAFTESCHSSLVVNIDWDAFEAIDQKNTPAMGSTYLKALQTICAIDDDYKNAIEDITTINISPSSPDSAHAADLQGNAINLQINKHVPNVSRSGYELLFDLIN